MRKLVLLFRGLTGNSLFFDTCLLTGELSEVEYTCPAYCTNFVNLDILNER